MRMNFGNSFLCGFASGMFGINPFWGGCCTPFSMFGNPFCCSNSLYFTPNMMIGPFTQLMPNYYPPSFNLSMPSFDTFTPIFDIPKPDFSTIWENKDIWKTNSNETSWGDVFKRSKSKEDENAEATNTGGKALKNNPNAKLSSRDSTQYDGLIKKYAAQFGVDANLVKAVMWQESKFNRKAKSGAGAKGLMQLMPATAKDMGVTNPYDPEQSIMGGTKYLKQMLDESGGNIERALACYNAGPNAVKKYGGIPPFAETQKYVTEVMKKYRQYSA